MGGNVRRMTADDYAELGIEPPADVEPEFPCSIGSCQRHRACMYLNHPRCGLHGLDEPERCEECGDEEGECSCADE